MIKITKIFIANVGVNTNYENKYGIKSPIFSNGTFEFIPIKESDKIKGEISHIDHVNLIPQDAQNFEKKIPELNLSKYNLLCLSLYYL